MALWSNNDAVPGLATARYTVAANAAADGTCTVTGTGSSFGLDGCAGIGTVSLDLVQMQEAEQLTLVLVIHTLVTQ